MNLISRSLLLALITLVTWSAMPSAHAEIVIKGNVIKGNIDLSHLLDRSIIFGDTDASQGTLDRLGNTRVLKNTIEPGPQAAPDEAAAVPVFLPVMRDEPVIDSVKSTGTHPNNLGAPQPGPEPYVMLLVGLGMIVLAITLHLKSMHQTRSGFKPSQGMPFV